MLKLMKRIVNSVLIAVFLFMMIMPVAFSQPDPGHNGDGSKVGGESLSGGASIGGGVGILISLGIGYGISRLYKVRKRSLEE
jgi:hypothetical protein